MVEDVLANVTECLLISKLGSYRLNIYNVYEYLSIFNWEKETINRSELKAMKSFLELAIELGLTNSCRFKIRSYGFCNEMWAYGNKQAIHCLCGCTKYINKYSFDIGDGTGFCNAIYISKAKLNYIFEMTQTK